MVTFTFLNPEFLWFLMAMPLLAVAHFFFIRYTRKKALKFANFSVLKRATGHNYITKNYTMFIIRMLIIICIVLAVSRLVVWYESPTNENEFVIAIDTSASMSAQDISPSRLEAAKVNAKQFVEEIDPPTKIGLISFSGVTFIESVPTLDYNDLLPIIDEVGLSASGTDIPGAIITSTNLLINTEKGRAIILISDGSNTIETFHSKSIQRALAYARINRIKIHTIGIGTDVDSPIGYLPSFYNVTASYNQKTLEYIANATEGSHYTATDTIQLRNAYKEIGATEQSSMLQKDLAGWLMLVALCLVMIEWILLSTRFRTLP